MVGSIHVKGIDLVGEASESMEFPYKRRVPALKVEEVMRAAKWTRKASMKGSTCSTDKELDKAVWEKTKEELKKQFAAPTRRSS